jgi:hypothetical protein
MLTLERTITVPADRRVVFDLPETVPEGETSVVLTFPGTESLEEPGIIPHAEAMAAARKYIRKHLDAFKALAQ